jgi:hypothetical protein
MSWLRLIEERMKAKTPDAAAAGDEVPDEPTSKPKVRTINRFRHLISEMWPAYLMEIVVIILGISITLALEEWRAGSKENKLENIYRANLLADIDVDLEDLQYTSATTKTLLTRGEAILNYEKGSPTHSLSDTALTADLRSILQRPKFIPHDATFDELKSSGNLHLINDIDLKWLLFAYYNKAQIIKEVQDAEQQATITLVGPYFVQRFQMDAGLEDSPARHQGEGPTAFANDVQFRNLVLLRVATRKELLADYRAADSLATKLKAALQQNYH